MYSSFALKRASLQFKVCYTKSPSSSPCRWRAVEPTRRNNTSEAQPRGCRRQSKKTPIQDWFLNFWSHLSSELMDGELIISSIRLFRLSMVVFEKKYMYLSTSLEQRCFSSIKEWPLHLRPRLSSSKNLDAGTDVSLVNISNTSIKSARFLLSSKVHRPMRL